jgi:hypothetical protein
VRYTSRCTRPRNTTAHPQSRQRQGDFIAAFYGIGVDGGTSLDGAVFELTPHVVRDYSL